MPSLEIRLLSAREQEIIGKLEQADERELKVHLGQYIGVLEHGEDPAKAAEHWLGLIPN
jgi:hypothetical protein